MSCTGTLSTTAPSSNFQLIFNDALKAYEKRTRNDLITHPLAAQLQECNSPSDILTVLQTRGYQKKKKRPGVVFFQTGILDWTN